MLSLARVLPAVSATEIKLVTEFLRHHEGPRPWLGFLLLGLAAAGLDSLSLFLSHYGAHIVTIWPAKGLVLAVCLRAQPKSIHRILLVAGTAGIVTKLAFGGSPLAAVAGTVVSLSGTLAVFWLTARFVGTGVDFREWRSLAAYLLIVCGSVLVFGALGGAYLSLSRTIDFSSAWLSWSLSSGLSYAILTPLLVLLATMRGKLHGRLRKKRKLAAIALAMSVLLVAVFSQSDFPVAYLIPLGLVVVALTSDIEETVVCLLLTAIIAVGFTALGMGPVTVIHGPPALQVLASQLFAAAITITMLPAAAALNERNRLRLNLGMSLDRERRKAEELRASEQHHRLLAEQSKDIIVRAGFDTVLTYVSPGCRALGYEPYELIGISGVDLVHPEDREQFMENARSLLRGDAQDARRKREHRFRTKTGGWVWLQGNPAVVRDPQGNPVEIINVFRDIMEQRKTNGALAEALKGAEAAVVAKGEFLANMSHELRTPLTSIIGFSQLLKEQPELSPASFRFAERTVQASQALLAVVNDVLDFSKLEAGQIEIKRAPVVPVALASDALQLFAPQASEKSLRLLTEVAGKIPETLQLDEARVRQILLNLIGNAVKFTETGTVTVRLSYSAGNLRCEVTDTGAGIPEDKLDKLFQRFSQIDGSSSRGHGGSGLGLAICRGLVHAMGGKVSVRSTEGRGSTFGFEIPAPSSYEEQSDQVVEQSHALRGLRILAVDDNHSNRALLQALLTPLGVDLVLASGGLEAVEQAAASRFDAILMDVHMPDVNGFDAARRIRAAAAPNTAPPILAFTADAVRDVSGDGNEALFAGVVLKPASLAALCEALASARAKNPTTQDARDAVSA